MEMVENLESGRTIPACAAFDAGDALEKGSCVQEADSDIPQKKGCSSQTLPKYPRRNSSYAIPNLPAKTGNGCYRFIRWNFFSVYRRVFTIVFAANTAALSVGFALHLLGGYNCSQEEVA